MVLEDTLKPDLVAHTCNPGTQKRSLRQEDGCVRTGRVSGETITNTPPTPNNKTKNNHKTKKNY